MGQEHHLAAILFTDIVGYTGLMQQDENLAITALRHHNDAVKKFSEKFGGQVTNFYGDGCLVVFNSAIDAMDCAIAIQNDLQNPPVPVRIGLHLGEIVFEKDKAVGDGVNIASRVQSLGIGNSILMSATFHESIKNHPEYSTQSLGFIHFKNVKDEMEVFALANEGFQIPTDLEGKLERKGNKNQMRFVAIPILLILIGYLSYKYVFSDSLAGTEKSIAVLAFQDLSTNMDQEYLSMGMAEEIHNRLCKFEELKVAAVTSSFSFRDKDVDIETIGKSLKVANVLEGSVRKDQEKILITIRLTNARSGYTLLSESYSGDFRNVFDLQSKIALDIAGKIEDKLSLRNKDLLKSGTIDPVAYEAYLKGRAQFVNGPLNMKADEIWRAKRYFEEAISISPAFVEAHAYLSLAYFNMADWALSRSEKEKIKVALDSAMLLAKISLDLDSLNSASRLAMGSYYFHKYDWINSEREKRMAVELNPGGAEEKFVLASFLAQFGQAEEALELDREALDLDPLDEESQLKYIRDLYRGRYFEEAVRLSQKIISEDPSSTGGYQFLWLSHSGNHQFDEAQKALVKLYELQGMTEIADLIAHSDYKSGLRKYLDFLESPENNGSASFILMALLYGELQDRSNTLRYLDSLYDKRLPTISFTCQPMFDFIREDPEFKALREKAGFTAYFNKKNAVEIPIK